MGSPPDATTRAPPGSSSGMTTTASTDTKIDTVLQLYAAYARGDLDAVLADLADDVDWAAEAARDSVPWYGSHRGRTEVPRFFHAISSSVDVTEFTVLSVAANDTDVSAVVHWAYTVRANGKRAAMLMQHWWRFTAGRSLTSAARRTPNSPLRPSLEHTDIDRGVIP